MSSYFGLLIFVGFLALSIPLALSTSYIDNIRSSPKHHEEGSQPPDYYLYVDEETTLPKVNSLDDTDNAPNEPDLEVRRRWKRDAGEPGWKVAGAGLTKTFKRLVAEASRIPPSIKLAIDHGNFSNVTKRDIELIDPTLLEYVPPKLFPTFSPLVRDKVIDMFLAENRAHALSNFLEATAKQIDAETLLQKINLKRGKKGEELPPNEAESVLIYVVASRKLGNGTNDQVTVANLIRARVLKYVPEELFMRVRNADAARTTLSTLYQKSLDAETNNIDDKALIYRLVEIGYGSGKTIRNNFENLLPKFYPTLPGAFFRSLPLDLINERLPSFKTVVFSTTAQQKAVTDSYMLSMGIDTNNIEGATTVTKQQGSTRNIELRNIVNDLDSFAAFVNPGITQDDVVLRKIVDGCNHLNLPAPVKAVHQIIKLYLRGNKQIQHLHRNDFGNMKESVLINSPPSIIRQAMAQKYFNKQTFDTISRKVEESPSTTYLKGLVQQLTTNTTVETAQGTHLLPPAFLNAIGIHKLLRMDGNSLKDVLEKLNRSQDSLDEVQKGVLIRRLQDNFGLLDLSQDQSVVPPAIAALLPRAKNQRILPSIVSGLPSESDLRLAFGEQQRHVGPQTLVDEPLLVGTLTPSQVQSFRLEDIPLVLSTIRKSSDGPSSHTLKVLSERFADYIRNKTDDRDSNNKKLLKYLSAAEISRLPATVLAYFLDSRYVRRLPDDARKEIMVALGTLSTKDHALIPSRTREEIVVQGLEALDKTLANRNVYDVVVVAMLAHAVVDLPADRIRKLDPVALELALDVVQGNVDDDDDGLRQRACLKPEQKHAWRNKIIETYGTPNTWTHGTVTSLCCALVLLEEHDLRQIAKENLVTCKCISDDKPPSHLKNLRQALNGACAYELGRPDSSLYTLNKVQAEMGLDIEDLEEQTIQMGTGKHGRRNRRGRTRRDGGYSVQGQEEMEHEEEVKPLRCTSLRLVGNAAEYNLETVNTFWEKEIDDCLYELGLEPLSIEAARALWMKLLNMHDKNVRKISSFKLRKAGYILRGISKADVDQLDFGDDDIVAPFGVNLGLPKILLEHMATHLEHSKRRDWQHFSASDIIVAGNIICGADAKNLTKLNQTSFRQALPHLKSLHQDCEMTRLAALANIATTRAVFGDPSQWTAADVRGLGIIFKGLASKEVVKIQPEAFLGLSPSVAANLVPETLRVLTPAQVEHIPRFSALAMRNEQINTLMPEARENLESNKKGSLVSGATTNKVQMETIWTLLTFGLTILFAQRVL